MDERAYLKVKVKSLAEEARIIRKESKRAKRLSIKRGLDDHRKGIVRYEARHTHLAYGFLRGREYHEIEQKAHEAPDWKKVRKMVEKYGTHIDYGSDDCDWKNHSKRRQEVLKRFDQWVKDANPKEGIVTKVINLLTPKKDSTPQADH